jgi:cyanophycin synthetase
VVEVVDSSGVSVLNADDPLTLKMQSKAGGQLILFSIYGAVNCTSEVQQHIAAGGTAVVLEPTVVGDEIVLYEARQRLPIMRARDIPATLGGLAAVNIQNALAATAIATAQRIPPAVIRAALSYFSTSFEQNPGRLNLYEVHPFRVILDYAHNPTGMEYLKELIAHLRPLRGRVIGVIGVAGDRRDEDIRRMGELAAKAFDKIIAREDDYRRGRPKGEGAKLIQQGAFEVGFLAEHFTVILNEKDAVAHALNLAQQGDLVIVLATEVDVTWRQIRDFSSQNPDETRI